MLFKKFKRQVNKLLVERGFQIEADLLTQEELIQGHKDKIDPFFFIHTIIGKWLRQKEKDDRLKRIKKKIRDKK